MARPKIIDYDETSDEEIITQGVQGAKPTWIGFDVDRQVIHIVCDEGVLNGPGDDIETVTRGRQQVTLEDADVVTFYQAHKAAMDEIIQAALETWAASRSKTGSVISG